MNTQAMRAAGKQTCDLAFIAAFLDARDEADRLDRTVPIKGYSGWKVCPSKALKVDLA